MPAKFNNVFREPPEIMFTSVIIYTLSRSVSPSALNNPPRARFDRSSYRLLLSDSSVTSIALTLYAPIVIIVKFLFVISTHSQLEKSWE